MQTVKIGKDYRVLIPQKVRNIVLLKAGDELDVKVAKKALIKLVPKKSVVEETRGLWVNKDNIGNSIEYVNKLRDEWSQRMERLEID